MKIQDELNFQVALGKIDRYLLEKRHLGPDGQTVWVFFGYRMRNCGDGTFEDLSCVVDIMERKLLRGDFRWKQGNLESLKPTLKSGAEERSGEHASGEAREPPGMIICLACRG